jgi:hypothetical protein
MSDARGRAHVHCVIIGLTPRDDEPKVKRLFSYPQIDGDTVESTHLALSPYLFDASKLKDRHLVVQEVSRPLAEARKLISGSQPIDDGNYISSALCWLRRIHQWIETLDFQPARCTP